MDEKKEPHSAPPSDEKNPPKATDTDDSKKSDDTPVRYTDWASI